MASALASPPPVSFGSSDLKGNARRFLERALLISAMVHLTGVLLFRSAYERALRREGAEPTVPTWNTPVDVGPKLIPFDFHGGNVSSADKGIYVPTDKPNVPFPTPFDFGTMTRNSNDPIPNPGPGPDVGRSLPPPPPETPGPPPIPDVLPIPTYAPIPPYPEYALEAHVEGRVLVKVLVGVDGLPKDVIAVSGSNFLTGTAVEAVRRWRFRPALANGKPVEVWVEIPVLFHF